MIPNVCMAWCQRQAQCGYCPDHIEAGNPMVTVFFWHKGEDGKRGLNAKLYYHPGCWVENGLDYLKKNPYVAYIRHKPTQLTTKQKIERLKILRRKTSLEQRRRNLKPTNPDHNLVVARMDRQVAELMVQIVKVGGIPPKWLT